MQNAAEEINRKVQLARRKEGQEGYDAAYAVTMEMLRQGDDEAKTPSALFKPVELCEPNGLPLILRQLNAVHQELARIKQQAVEDANAESTFFG